MTRSLPSRDSLFVILYFFMLSHSDRGNVY